MAKLSVPATCLSGKDILKIGQIIDVNLRYFVKHKTPHEEDYRKHIRTVIGLGFAAALVDKGLLLIYQDKMNLVLGNKFDDGNQIAKLIDLSFRAFYYLGYPNYYQSFLISFQKLIDNVNADLFGFHSDVVRLLKIIMPSYRC